MGTIRDFIRELSNMSTPFMVFMIAACTVLYAIIYMSLYFIFYVLLRAERIIHDKYLVWLLLATSLGISFFVFPVYMSLLKFIFL